MLHFWVCYECFALKSAVLKNKTTHVPNSKSAGPSAFEGILFWGMKKIEEKTTNDQQEKTKSTMVRAYFGL
jgi:hypothetical protein